MNTSDYLRTSNSKDTDERISCFISTLSLASRTINASCFAIDFNVNKMLWRSDRMLFIDKNGEKGKQRDSANPYWAYTSEEIYRQLCKISSELCKTIKDRLASYRNGVACSIDFPICVDGNIRYVSQKTAIRLFRDPTADAFNGFHIVAVSFVTKSPTETMGSALTIPKMGVFPYDMSKNRFADEPVCIDLTRTEKEVLYKFKEGLQPNDVASEMNVSINTVKSHKAHIFKKLGVSTLPDAIAVAGRYELI